MTSRQITTLPLASRSILRSTTIITSLPQIISELVQNSLDAGASHVDVGVDAEGWQCWVRDDGQGMDISGMSILSKGGEQGRYGSSKAYNPASLANVSTFGFRGEALASAADLSCLEISSRTSASRETWSVILKGGKKLYYGPAVRWRCEKPGTTVYIRDAFYNLPIRRLSHPNVARTLELIRKNLECVALVFPSVAFSLENSAKEKEDGGGKGRIVTIPKTQSTLTAFRHLFGRALCEHVDEIDECMADMRIQGFLSLEGAHSKAHQYLYVNRYPLSQCDLHRAIDAKFTASSFGKHAFDEAGESKLRSTTRRSPRKNERRPVYVLNITIPPSSVDNCLEPAKAIVHFEDPDAVSNFLSSVIQSFLARHGFCLSSSKANLKAADNLPSSRKRRKISTEGTNPDLLDPTFASAESNRQDVSSSRPPSRGARRQGEDVILNIDPTADCTKELTWVDPWTGRVYTVDPRTGNSYDTSIGKNRGDGCSVEDGGGRRDGQRGIVDTTRLRTRKDICCEDGESVPDWIQQALDDNPTFGLQKPGIPSLISLSSSSRHLEPGGYSSRRSRSFDPNLTAGHKHNAADVSQSFDREQLRHARVVGQVDKKFVACLLEGTESSMSRTKTLVLVDQHAADERIRVERFLSELCEGFLDHDRSGGVETLDLRPPVPVLLTRLEARALSESETYRRAFERWGFRFVPIVNIPAAGEDGGGDEYVQVFMATIPEVVSEKLLSGNELGELVKGFLAKLEEEGAAYSVGAARERNYSETRWTTVLRWCPRELLDLVNSKACRGAIMFNDSLDLEQCNRLIQQLAQTIWPFMCAHGRPSLVPMTNVECIAREDVRMIDWSKLEYVDQ